MSQIRSESANFQKGIQNFFEDIRRIAWQQAKIAINDWLDISKFDEQYNVSLHYEKQRSSRLEGTCEWIFSKPAYCEWASEDLSDDKTKFLWICGPPGYGKTMLCARLIEHCQEKLAVPTAYFFSSAHAQSGGQPSLIVRSWIGQIARVDSDAMDLVRGYCERSEAGRVASETDVWSVFESIISQKIKYTFALDGFDEYARLDDARAQFLRRLKKATEGTSTRILISSRDETDIRCALLPESGQTAGSVMLECKISREDVGDDITLFSRRVVDEKLPKKDEALRQDLAGQLADRCGGMFLWIKLHQDQLRGGKNAKQLHNIVQNMPAGLRQTYERHWKTIQSRPVDEQKRALAILRWATFAMRPLTVWEMTEALIVETGDDGASLPWDELPDTVDNEYINGEIIDICGCLVEVRKMEAGDPAGAGTIQLIHPSVRDFLLTVLSPNPELVLHPSLLSDQASDHSGQHNYLATVCLIYLNCADVWNQSDVDLAVTDRHPFLRYAAHYWHSHIGASNKDDDKVISLVNELLCTETDQFCLWRRYFETSPQVTDKINSKHAGATPLYYTALFNLIPSMEFILAQGKAQLNSVGVRYGTPLQAACAKGHWLAFDSLIQWGANPNVEGGEFGVPLNAAAYGGHLDMVKSLVHHGAAVELRDFWGQTPLHRASKQGYPDIVNFLLEAGADLKTKDKYGWTSLHVAAFHDQFEVARLLLDRKADVAISNENGWTSLHLATQKGHLDVIKLLLDRGADVNMSNNEGWTSLHLAAQKGHLDVIKLLLDRGADVNMSNNEGWTSLHLAAQNGHFEVVELLLSRGADFTMTDNYGWTPLDAAAEKSHLGVVQLLLNGGDSVLSPCQPVEEPLGSRFDINTLGGPHGSIINTAAYTGHLEMLQMLVENYKANIFATDWLGRTPLHVAARGGNLDCMNYLLNSGLHCSDVDNIGNNVLHYACSGGSTEAVWRILKLDPSTADGSPSWTPLHWACRIGDSELIQLLLSHGFHKSVVHTTNPSANWTPASIGMFHQNPTFDFKSQKRFMNELDVFDPSGSFSSTELLRDLRGICHGHFWCNYCFHVSFISTNSDPTH